MPGCAIGSVKIHVEVPLLLIFIAFMLSDSVKTNLMIYRTCYALLGYNRSECALLGTKNPDNQTANLEKIVQPYANVISLSGSILEASVSAVACFFAGPWSDRFGRKPLLIIPLIGFFFSYVCVAIYAALTEVSPWYSVICVIPILLTGGFSSFITAALCYITDVTSEANRGIRMAWFEGILTVGILLGNVASSYVLSAVGYSNVFLISGSLALLAALFSIFCIPESVIDRESGGSFEGLFQLENVGDMLKTTFKKRPKYNRAIVLASIAMLTIFIIAVNADGSVAFMYLREKLHWSLEKYTLYSAGHNVIWILGSVVGVGVLHKIFNITESVLILVGFISMLNSALLQGFASTDFEIYGAAAVRCLGGVLSPMIRSMVTKIIPADEIGKIFSLIVTSESLFGMIGAPLYTAIYNKTIKTNPSVFNFVTAGFYAAQILIIIAVILMQNVKGRAEADDRLLINEQNDETGEEVDA